MLCHFNSLLPLHLPAPGGRITASKQMCNLKVPHAISNPHMSQPLLDAKTNAKTTCN